MFCCRDVRLSANQSANHPVQPCALRSTLLRRLPAMLRCCRSSCAAQANRHCWELVLGHRQVRVRAREYLCHRSETNRPRDTDVFGCSTFSPRVSGDRKRMNLDCAQSTTREGESSEVLPAY